MTKTEYEACQARDETGFRSAIEGLTLRALQDGLQKVDYPAIVADEWRKNNFDDVLDKRVDLTVAEVTNETSLWERGRSLFNQDKAKELATSVAGLPATLTRTSRLRPEYANSLLPSDTRLPTASCVITCAAPPAGVMLASWLLALAYASVLACAGAPAFATD